MRVKIHWSKSALHWVKIRCCTELTLYSADIVQCWHCIVQCWHCIVQCWHCIVQCWHCTELTFYRGDIVLYSADIVSYSADIVSYSADIVSYSADILQRWHCTELTLYCTVLTLYCTLLTLYSVDIAVVCLSFFENGPAQISPYTEQLLAETPCFDSQQEQTPPRHLLASCRGHVFVKLGTC
jgi:hypothetical protein